MIMYRGRKSKELTGKEVLVHPDLTTDPINRQGQAGCISHDNGDHVTVTFGDGTSGRYDYNALLVLAGKYDIINFLLSAKDRLTAWEKGLLLEVLRCQQEGKERQALLLLADIPEAMESCTKNFEALRERIAARNKGKLRP